MSILASSSENTVAYRRGRLYIESVPVEELARRYGTPLYVYSKAALLGRYEALAAAFETRVPLICFALKANPNAAVCRVLARAGAGADVVSGGELRRALAAGFAPEGIVFSGVGKTEEELELAVRRRILSINVESREELDILIAVAKRLRRPAAISIRLNPNVDARTHPHITTGLSENKFGLEREEALSLYRRAARSPWLRVKGIQCHIGSQIGETAPYARAARAVAGVIARLDKEGIRLELADLGGGLGITYGKENAVDPVALARVIEKSLSPWPGLRLILEPGRYLAADAGLLLTRVLYRKETSRRRFIVVDAGMSDLARPALYGAHHPIWPARRGAGREETVDVVGPLCESGDFMARGRRLAKTKRGDLLAVLKSGAYGFAMSSQYNSRPRAAEVLVDGSTARLARRRETWKDLVRHEV